MKGGMSKVFQFMAKYDYINLSNQRTAVGETGGGDN